MDELVLGELECALGVLARELETTAMDGDDGDRQMVLRPFESVLDRDVIGVSSVRGSQRPASGPELEPGKAPERVGAPRLVALSPFPVLPFEQRAGLASPGRRRERVHEGQGRLLYQLVAADRGREVAHPPPLIGLGRCFPGEPRENRLHGASVRPE